MLRGARHSFCRFYGRMTPAPRSCNAAISAWVIRWFKTADITATPLAAPEQPLRPSRDNLTPTTTTIVRFAPTVPDLAGKRLFRKGSGRCSALSACELHGSGNASASLTAGAFNLRELTDADK
ncbi:hypothetical protein KCP69_10140 [Salmonella enterica subsp. enterica]|nr:hypothetical protein KCP69_10140 [Salmonella enterica subsp. enterica]